MDKLSVINNYNLNKKQTDLINKFLKKLIKSNETHNLVGMSTIENAWDRHVNDSLQLSEFIPKKKSSIVDLGTGAGFPGVILYIFGYTNILLIDSKIKKINFIRDFADDNNIFIKTICTRVEKLKSQKFDYITCRAFAPLVKLLNYSLVFSKKNTSLLFLKGRNVKKEIIDAKLYFDFNYKIYESKSEGDGFILSINRFRKL